MKREEQKPKGKPEKETSQSKAGDSAEAGTAKENRAGETKRQAKPEALQLRQKSIRLAKSNRIGVSSHLDWRIISAIAIGIAIALFYTNATMFTGRPQLFAALNGIAVGIALGVPVYVRYREYVRIKELEQMFPAFMRDITENINVGMSLPKAIRTASANDYGRLTPYIQEIAAKIDWGVPFEKVLLGFAEKAKSAVLSRIVKGIIEAHKSGGTIGTVMQAMTASAVELERIKKERAARIYSQMVTGYFIFFLFLGIMLAMSKLLIPILTFQLAGATGMADISRVFTETFRSLVVIQGIFAGLGIGKMSEGTITAGFKHSFVLTVIGYTVFVIF
ncbi:MAG: type II secretion system F family protein [Candidatus Aenigmatarchaeota archaeon]